jgi:hypothetical protein
VFHQRFSIIVESFREVQFSLENVLINDERIVISEGVDAGDHFIDQNAKCPPVYWFSVTLILKNLGGKILRGSTKGESPVLNGFGKTEVCEFEVAISAN